ncbi:MAG: hypothetical protein WC238_04600 [Parcubacteria group bacterium]
MILSGEETKAELIRLGMENALPVLPAKVPEFLPAPFYEWHLYDPNDPATHPTQDPYEIWSGRQGNERYWELEGTILGRYFQGAGNSVHITDADGNLTIWNTLEVKKYRRMNTTSRPVKIPNPQFPIVEAERAAKKAQFEAILRPILTPIGQYQFRGFPLGDDPHRTDPTKYGYGWEINGVDIPKSPAHRLAILAWGFAFLEAPMRNPENVTTSYRNTTTGERFTRVVDHYEHTMAAGLKAALDVADYESRMNALLHLLERG